MTGTINKENSTSLLRNLFLAVGSIILINAIVFSLDWDKAGTSQIEAEFAPPGYVVGIVWVGLFVLMGVSRWMVV